MTQTPSMMLASTNTEWTCQQREQGVGKQMSSWHVRAPRQAQLRAVMATCGHTLKVPLGDQGTP